VLNINAQSPTPSKLLPIVGQCLQQFGARSVQPFGRLCWICGAARTDPLPSDRPSRLAAYLPYGCYAHPTLAATVPPCSIPVLSRFALVLACVRSLYLLLIHNLLWECIQVIISEPSNVALQSFIQSITLSPTFYSTSVLAVTTMTFNQASISFGYLHTVPPASVPQSACVDIVQEHNRIAVKDGGILILRTEH
jgi:hypothetical protein